MPQRCDSKAGRHRTVLEREAIEQLLTDPAGTYVDATFGRGGHARALLARLAPAARLIAFDRDPTAVEVARSCQDSRFHIEHTAFSQLDAKLDALAIGPVAGVLMDLGVSSPQIDEAARGFTWRGDGPLDMRMDTTSGETAGQWLARASLDELTQVIRDYGEERFAASIAKAIVARRASGRPLAGTADLAALVAAAIPARNRKDGAQHPATRTFQAVRIHLNQELAELALALEQAARRLQPGGRLVVISFHSLEDRIVKQFMVAHAHPERDASQLRRAPLTVAQLPAPRLAALPKVRASDEEIAANPRARSAVMRVAERTQTPWPDRSS
jgi:16S rRNA (cytosine1402-N4)-methyltransferase